MATARAKMKKKPAKKTKTKAPAKPKKRTAKPKPRPQPKPNRPARKMAPKKSMARRAPAPRPEAPAGPKLPSYDELPVRPGAPQGAAWGVFGDDDEVGTINLLTPPRVRAAAALVRSGKVFALNLPINIPYPPLFSLGKHRQQIKKILEVDF